MVLVKTVVSLGLQLELSDGFYLPLTFSGERVITLGDVQRAKEAMKV